MKAQPRYLIGRKPAKSKYSIIRETGAFLVFLCVLPLAFSSHAAQKTLNKNPGWPGTTLGGVDCYGKPGGHGPFDYVSEKSKIGIVEQWHFKPKTEQLVDTAAHLDGDLDYTLRAIPNNHRALWARSRFYLRMKEHTGTETLEAKERAQQGNPPPECYFQRAKVFNPQDGMVSAIFGIYLHKRGKPQAALTEYRQAEEKLPRHAELLYNMGLLYFDMNDMENARKYADQAKALGYPLDGLHRKIKNVETGK